MAAQNAATLLNPPSMAPQTPNNAGQAPASPGELGTPYIPGTKGGPGFGGPGTPTGNTAPPPTSQNQNTQSNTSTGNSTESPPQTNLTPGSTGTDVTQLQSYLASMGWLNSSQIGSESGTYGPETTAAVAQMQKALGVQAGNNTGDYGPKTQAALAQKYKGIFGAIGNTAAPETGADANSQIQGYTQTSTDPVFSSLMASMEPILGSLTQVLSNINNPALTAVSLQSEYNNLATQYNLPGMNTQLLNMQNVMNGTQQDIQNEITAAGGTATASQVLALSSARNTVILQQYNALNSNYQAAVQNVSNMMQYATADQSFDLQRQTASASIAEQMGNIVTKLASMGMTMGENATSNYQSTLKSLGYNYTSFASSVPSNMQPYVESLLGLAPGTLSNPTELAILTKTSQTQIADMYKEYSLGLPAVLPSGGGGSGNSAPVQNTIVGGIDFGGQATGTQPYASNVSAEVAGVGRSYNDIVGAYGSANPTSTQMQSYITNNAPNSTITGSMINTAASQYGIAPAILAATLNNETSFGTAGEALNGTNNPGGITDPATGEYMTYDNMQDGVNAAALNLSLRQVSQTPSSSGSTPTTPLQAKINQQTPQFQQWANNLPTFDGVPYYTTTNLTGDTTGEKAAIVNAANAVGLQVLTPKDSDALDSIDSAQTTLNSFGTFIATGASGGAPLLPASASGQPKQYEDVTLNDYLATNNQLAAFNSWKLAVIPVLSGLKGTGSGGGGSSRLFGTVGDLIPDDTDTLPEAMQKINNIQTILMGGAKSILGNNAPFVQPSPPALFGPQGMMVLGSDGTYNLVK